MASLAFHTSFQNLKDPRRAPRHRLLDSIGIAICAVISGANDWQQIATFARQRRPWLQRCFPLPNGIPCHDTFERVFERINPRAFAAAFAQWMRNHGGIENNLHWKLDGTFHEDSNREQGRHGAANLAPVRKLALALLKRHPGKKRIACKRLHAALDVNFLQEVIQQSENF
jgi:hypothetical protein